VGGGSDRGDEVALGRVGVVELLGDRNVPPPYFAQATLGDGVLVLNIVFDGCAVFELPAGFAA